MKTIGSHCKCKNPGKESSLIMESYQFIISLIEGTSDLIHSLDSDGNFEFVNTAWLEALEYDENEIHTLGLKDILSPDNVEKHQQLVSSVFNGESYTGVEVPLVTKSGNIVQTKANLFPRREGNKILAATGFFRDVTEEMIVQEKLEESRSRSEWLIDLMIHDLTNINQEMLTTFEIILDSPLSPNQLTSLSREALLEIERASNLITNVRKITHLDFNVPETTKWDLAETIGAAIKTLEKNFSDKKLILDTDIKSGQYFLIANEYFKDVFYCLLHNSMKFDKRNEVIVEVRADPAKRIPFLRIQVKDYGPGIPEKDKETVFDILSHRKENIRGLGLGLTLVKKIVESYGGYIRVEDRVEGDHTKGANFIIIMKYETSESKSKNDEVK